MPDACDLITDVQLKAADDFARFRLGALVLLPLPSLSVCRCGAVISAARQAAVPGVQRCTRCQAFAEAPRYGKA